MEPKLSEVSDDDSTKRLASTRVSETFLDRARQKKIGLLEAIAQDEAPEEEGPGIFSFGPPPSPQARGSVKSVTSVVPEPDSPTPSGDIGSALNQDSKLKRKSTISKSRTSMNSETRSMLDRHSASRTSSYLANPVYRSSICRKIVEHNMFGLFVIATIFGQSVYLCLENMENIIVTACFALIYVVEQALRLGAYGAAYFYETWNLVDLLLVSLTLADLVMALSMGDSQLDVVVGLRLLRLLRLGGMVRLFRYFKQLWQLATGIVTSIRTVVWAWMLIGLIIYVYGLIFFRTLKPDVCEEGARLDNTAELQLYFGSLSKSWFTVFQIVTLEEWPQISALVGKHISGLVPMVLLLLILTTYGIMHVTVAIFVSSALEASSVRSQDLARKAKDEHEAMCRKLAKVFFAADKDNNGVLSREEFDEALGDLGFVQCLRDIGMDASEAAALFDILDIDGNASLDGAEFVEGVLRSVGQAQNKDLIGLRCDIWRASISVNEDIQMVNGFLRERMEETTQRVKALSQDAAPVLLKAAEVMHSKLR